MLSGHQMVCLSSLPLEGRPSSWAHLARVFARHNDVLFVDPPRNILRHTPVFRGHLCKEPSGMLRLEPPSHLPYGTEIRRRLTGGLNRRRYAAGVARAIRQLGWSRPVLWHSMPTMFSADVAELVEPGVEVLYVTDDVWLYPGWTEIDEIDLKRVATAADVVVATTDVIADRLSVYGVGADVLPQGVDVSLFEPVAHRALTVEPALAALPRPRLGFVGQLDWRLDIDVLVELAASPGSLVLVGPSTLDSRAVERLRDAGCRLYGEVAYEAVPSWLAGVDIALVPYKLEPAVVGARPLKLLDYLAAGLPVVSADIPAARELAPFVTTAAGPGGFREAVNRMWARRAADVDDADARSARVGLARENSWEKRAEELSVLIARVGDR